MHFNVSAFCALEVGLMLLEVYLGPIRAPHTMGGLAIPCDQPSPFHSNLHSRNRHSEKTFRWRYICDLTVKMVVLPIWSGSGLLVPENIHHRMIRRSISRNLALSLYIIADLYVVFLLGASVHDQHPCERRADGPPCFQAGEYSWRESN